MAILTRAGASCAALLLGFSVLFASDGEIVGVRLLPMDGVAVTHPHPLQNIVADAPLRTYRVTGESRPARAVKAPARIARTVRVPAGGGRFETFLAPLQRTAVMSVRVNDLPPISIAAPPGVWTPVRADLP